MTEKNNNLKDVELPIKRVTEDSVENILTQNAYENVLPSRYLKKDEDGQVIEDPSELFVRVAKNVALADVVYKSEDYDGFELTGQPKDIKPEASSSRRRKLCDEVFGSETSLESDDSVKITEHNVHAFAYESVVPKLPEEIEEAVESTKNSFHKEMKELSFMPNSPTLMNAGDDFQQLSACFVDSPDDDINNIHQTNKEAAKIFQSGGGMGYAFTNLRPYGDRVGSTGGIASGPISFMRTFDQMCGTIAQGGKRRGAQMGVMRVDHPDIIEFLHAKDEDVSLTHELKLNDPDDFTHSSFGDALEEARELIVTDENGVNKVPEHLRNAAEGHLSNFNISVGVTEEFMSAVQNGEEYELINPRTGEPHIATQKTKEMYGWFDMDDHVEVGEPLSIPAQDIYDKITRGSWENGEPGMIFLDRINNMHSFDTEEYSEHKIQATNPCGEQPLEEYEACNLGHINLSTIVDEDSLDWREFESELDGLEQKVSEFLDKSIDWDILNRRIKNGTHFLENVVTMSNFPVDEITEKVSSNRKIGLGIMGLAQMYIQLGTKYGSDVSNEIARQIMKYINHESKMVSHKISVGDGRFAERGVFDNWSKSKYADPKSYDDWFKKLTGLDPDYWDDGFKLRNHNTTTIAPTGTTSMIGDTTGGCEPIYNVAYYKNVSQDVQGEEMLVEFDDYFLRTLESNDIEISEVKEEAKEQMSNNVFDGVDSLTTVPDKVGELFVTTGDLSALEHADVQCALQEGVDSAISKTVNAPAHATPEDAGDAFMRVYKNGGKGVTYYRDGTRSKQVLTTREDNQETDDPVEKVKEKLEEGEVEPDELGVTTNNTRLIPEDRPKSLYGVTKEVETGYGDLFVTINETDDGDPFEVFANIGKSGGYTESFTESTARLISLCLRSGINPDEVIEQMEGIRSPVVSWDNGEKIHSVPDGIALAMRKYMNDGNISSNRSSETQELADDKIIDESSDTKNIVKSGENPECPKCSSLSLHYSEGCKTCEECGWSEC